MKTTDVVKLVGGVQQLCGLLNCTRAAVYQWNGSVPDARQYELEVKTRGVVKSDYTLGYLKRLNRNVRE